ncbi:RNA polymerase sigma factor [Vaginella massiliensis]|uniref:RNA polymerase sigma factor n=1 Tax=Vaginella massiliensis TaxID=1816680 RepID=UPI003750E30A
MEIDSKNLTDITDHELIKMIVATKDPQVFGVLYDRYAEKVFHKCIGFVSNTDEAQDLTHDIFLKLYIKLKSFNHEAKFSTWLYTLVYNHCVNYLQRERKSDKEELFDTENSEEQEGYEDIEDQAIYNLKFEKLQQALEKLDVNDKMILLMKYQDNFSIKEICQAYEISESAVKMRLNRAKTRLISIYNKI